MVNIDWFLFGAFPYMAIVIAIGGAFWRYSRDRFSYTSNSSQFLESGTLSRGSVLFHYGIITILIAHLLAFTFATEWRALLRGFSTSKNQKDWEIWLFSFELAGWVVSIITLIGLGLLIGRRLSSRRLHATTSVMDWVVLLILVFQVAMGFWIAIYYSWGSQWYGDTIMPWLESLVLLDPQPQYVSSIGFTVKLHIINAFLLIAIFPFTRLVHIFTIPITYLWRPYQIVVHNQKTPVEPDKELLTTRDHYKRRRGLFSRKSRLS
ncbi:MAG: respiratory nitrate reductase subunit gamma [Candidatus Heimdallarchaeota archaeon]